MFSFDHVFNMLVGLCEISIWWMIWQEHRKSKDQVEIKMPTNRWLLMLAFSLAPIGALAFHHVHYQSPPEFDDPNNALVTGWSREGTSCAMEVQEQPIRPLRADYKLATACLLYDGSKDILDAPYLQVGGLYDIDKYGNSKTLRAAWSPTFTEYYVQKHGVGVYVALLLVPNGVETYQFTTLRQARALGVRIPHLSAAAGTVIGND